MIDRYRATSAILTGGLIAGVCDITYAIGWSHFKGVSAMPVLQSVASGILGKAAMEGGAGTAALGLVFHFCIALIWASIFYAASRKITFLMRNPVISGILYGVFIYEVMYLFILPHSAYAFPLKFTYANVARNLFVHAFFIGLPIALATRRAYSRYPARSSARP